MATIQASIQLKDNMSPVLQKVVKTLNGVITKLGVVQTTGGKVTQSFDRVGASISKSTKYIELGNTQLTSMQKLVNANTKSEQQRAEIVKKITDLGKLDEQQKNRVTTLLNRSNTLYRGIEVLQAGITQKSVAHEQAQVRLSALKKAETTDTLQIAKVTANINALEKQIAADEQKIVNAQHTRKAIATQIANMGNVDVNIARQRTQLQNQYNSLLGNEQHRHQLLIAQLQKAADLEDQKAAKAQKAVQFAQQDVRQRLAGIEQQKTAQKAADAQRMADQQKWADKVLGDITKRHNAEVAAEQKIAEAMNTKWRKEWANFDKAQASMRRLIQQSEKNAQRQSELEDKKFAKIQQRIRRQEQLNIEAANKETQARLKAFDVAQASMRRLIIQAERRDQLEAKAAQRQIEREQKIAAKKAETAARQNDYLAATRNVTKEVEKSFSAQRKVAEQTAKANANQQIALNVNRQLASEKAKLTSLTSQLINIQTRINTLERQGKSVGTQMNALKARKASLLNQIGNQQQRILSVERQIKTETNNTANAQSRHNGYLRGAVNDANRLLQTLRNVVSVYAAFNAAKNTLGLADTMTMSRARLGLVNEIMGGTEKTADVQQKVYEAAMRSRGSYQEMASIVGKMGIRAGESFSGMDEIIGFTETLNKMAAVSGTSVNELNSALLQINQAMGAGRFQGDEFRSVSENLPLALQAVAKYKGVSVGALKDMAKKGEITADVFKKAVMSMAGEIDERFKKMPVTWEQVWTMCKNHMLKASDSILQRISKITSSERFVGFMQGVSEIFQKLSSVVNDVFGKMSDSIAYVYDNWNKLKPAIIGVVTALTLYKLVMGVVSAVTAVNVFWDSVHIARLHMVAGASISAAAAQTSLTAAMLACPWTWLVCGLLILGGVILSVMAATYDWESANIDVWGTIKNIGRAVAQKIKSAWTSLCAYLQPAIQAIGEAFNTVSAWIVTNWDKIRYGISVVVGLFVWFGQIAWTVGEWVWGALGIVWDALNVVWTIISKIVSIIADNWGWIQQVLLSIAGAIGIVALAAAAVAGVFAIGAIVVGVWNTIILLAKGIMALFTVATWKLVYAKTAEAIATWAAAAPHLFMIIVIGLLIAIIALLISWICEWCGVSCSAVGLICGAFAWLFAVVINIIAGVWNAILKIFDFVIDIVLSIIEWFLNAFGGGFDSFGDAVANLLGNIISWFLTLGQVVTTIIDAIFGTDWTGGLESLKSKVLSWGKKKGISVDLGRGHLYNNASVGRVNATDWWGSGYDFGEGIGNGLSNIGDGLANMGDLGKFTKHLGGIDTSLGKLVQTGAGSSTNNDLAKALTGGYDGKNPALDKIGKDTGTIAKNTGAGSGDVDHLRELAEREAINKYTLTDLHVDMTNNNNIGSGVDATDVGRRLWRALVNGALNQAQRAIPF